MPPGSRLAPVRSLGLEHPRRDRLTEVGVVEDRRFFLRDDTNRLVDRLLAGELVQISHETDPGATRLRMTFPDGTVLDDEVRLGEPIETPIHGRTGSGHVVDRAMGRGARAVRRSDVRHRPLRPPGGTRAGNPTSLVSDGSVAELARHAGVGRVDARRFRMLIELDGGAAHEEDQLDRPARRRSADAVLGSDEAGRPLRDHDPGPGHRRARPRHAPDDHRLSRAARRQGTLTSASRRMSSSPGGCASATRCGSTAVRLARSAADPTAEAGAGPDPQAAAATATGGRHAEGGRHARPQDERR